MGVMYGMRLSHRDPARNSFGCFMLALVKFHMIPYFIQMFIANFHRRLLRRFPYAIYYKTEDNQIIVFGLFHCARDPRTIRTQLQNRDKPKSF